MEGRRDIRLVSPQAYAEDALAQSNRTYGALDGLHDLLTNTIEVAHWPLRVLDLEVFGETDQPTECRSVVRYVIGCEQRNDAMRRLFKPDLFEDAGMCLAVLAQGFDDGTEFVLRNGRITP